MKLYLLTITYRRELKCPTVVEELSNVGAKWEGRCPGFNSQQLPAFSLASIFASKHLNSLYSNMRQEF